MHPDHVLVQGVRMTDPNQTWVQYDVHPGWVSVQPRRFVVDYYRVRVDKRQSYLTEIKMFKSQPCLNNSLAKRCSCLEWMNYMRFIRRARFSDEIRAEYETSQEDD